MTKTNHIISFIQDGGGEDCSYTLSDNIYRIDGYYPLNIALEGNITDIYAFDSEWTQQSAYYDEYENITIISITFGSIIAICGDESYNSEKWYIITDDAEGEADLEYLLTIDTGSLPCSSGDTGVTWTIGNKEVASLSIGGKEVDELTIDDTLFYEKQEEEQYILSIFRQGEQSPLDTNQEYKGNRHSNIPLEVLVQDSSSNNISNATVNILDTNDNILGTGITDNNGIATIILNFNNIGSYTFYASYNNNTSDYFSIIIKSYSELIKNGNYVYLYIDGTIKTDTVIRCLRGNCSSVVADTRGRVGSASSAYTYIYEENDNVWGCTYP
jgi:hypothetical protein